MTEPLARPEQHRTGRRGRPHSLDDATFAQLVAQAFVDGNTREQMCAMFGVKDPKTITTWRKDPRIKSRAMRLIEDRVLQITRKVDAQIQSRLMNAADLTVRELLEIRKEFLGGALRQQHEKADEETVTQAMEAIEENPALAEQLRDLLTPKPEPEDEPQPAPEPVSVG